MAAVLTGHMIMASSMHSLLSWEILGTMASSCQPTRSSPLQRRPGWGRRPSWSMCGTTSPRREPALSTFIYPHVYTHTLRPLLKGAYSFTCESEPSGFVENTGQPLCSPLPWSLCILVVCLEKHFCHPAVFWSCCFTEPFVCLSFHIAEWAGRTWVQPFLGGLSLPHF